MKRLFLFNPENDIALGMGLPRITPPRQAALLHMAGAMIPFWLGDEEDLLLVESHDIEHARRWREAVVAATGVAGPMPVSGVEADDEFDLAPWGWSLDAVAQFEKHGVAADAMAGLRGEMERRRELSHRRTSLKFLARWSEKNLLLRGPLPVEATSSGDVVKFLEENGNAVLKSPWSSSGRGVFPLTSSTLGASLPRIEGIIRNQGSVIVEPMLPKLQDFAMLFNFMGGKAVFAGYSLFFNSTDTNYGGNFVASDDAIVDRLGRWITRRDVVALRDNVAEILTEIIGSSYEGPLGVDMMVCGQGEDVWIAPCVEINLRYTMGFVAGSLFKKLGREGIMSVSSKNSSAIHDIKNGEEPLRLVPENPWFDFRFYPAY